MTSDDAETWKLEAEHAKLVIEHQRKELELQKISHEQWKVGMDAWSQSSKSAMDYARQAIGMILLINGGAAVAILTRVATPSRAAAEVSSGLGGALLLYAAGCALAAGAAGLSYLSQVTFTAQRNLPGHLLRGIAIAFWAGGLGLFIRGSWIASKVISG